MQQDKNIPEMQTLRQGQTLVQGKRNGTATAVLEKDLTIRGCYNVGTHDSSISEMVVNHEKNASHTITTATTAKVYGTATRYRIRKFTPRECFRLMGVSETDINKIQASGVSNSQQYKMAGNSIVVDVLHHIFRKMFIHTASESDHIQLDMFSQHKDLPVNEWNTARPLRVVTAFSGYDSQCMALDRLGIPYDLIAWSEIDRYAIMAHNAVYPQYADRNLGDISKINWSLIPDFHLFTYSFPCTDISTAGLQKGLTENSGTRSGLLWECRKTIDIKRPRFLLMENVEALISQKFIPEFRKWQDYLTSQGYTSLWKVLNAKDYGVPQSRPRVFMVSVLDPDVTYHFPKPFPLKRRIRDILEDRVEEKYYIRPERLEGIDLNRLMAQEYEE